jgi:hypothetical protein
MIKFSPQRHIIKGITVQVKPNTINPIIPPCTLAMHGGQPKRGLQKVSDVILSSQSATGPKRWSLLNTA